ncbi:MAG: Rv2993c-like domain-containing protein, partial [Terracoccus sp.]
MRIARYTTGEDPAYGIVQGDRGSEVITPLSGDPLYIGFKPSGDGPVMLEDARLLAPVIPRSKVVAIGRNYADHAKE